MAQEAKLTLPDGLLELRDTLECTWPASLAALRAVGAPLALYDDLDDEQLRAKALELGLTVADDADRTTVEKAITEKEKAKPPWNDDEFDPEKAWKLITAIRTDLDKIKTQRDELQSKVKEHDDASKSELEKLDERAKDAETRATAAQTELMRLRVAMKKDLTPDQAKRLVGETEEELEADADALLATFKPDDDGQEPEGRPRERTLRSGAAPTLSAAATDSPEKLAAQVPRPFR